MMEYTIKNFVNDVADKVKGIMGQDFQIDTTEVRKLNGVILPALQIKKNEMNIFPCIYLDDYYSRYTEWGMELEEIAEDIINTYEKSKFEFDCNISVFTDFNLARANLHCRLINKEKNLEILKDMPYRDVLDLALVYSVEFALGKYEIASILVKTSHMKMWNVTENDLYKIATENLQNANDGIFMNIAQLINGGIDEHICEFEDDGESFMYVLTNKSQVYGAVQMLNNEMLQNIGNKFKGDFAIIPSSLHELIIVPMNKNVEERFFLQYLKRMVEEVNDTKVSRTDILSYNVYRYCRKTATVSIVV